MASNVNDLHNPNKKQRLKAKPAFNLLFIRNGTSNIRMQRGWSKSIEKD